MASRQHWHQMTTWLLSKQEVAMTKEPGSAGIFCGILWIDFVFIRMFLTSKCREKSVTAGATGAAGSGAIGLWL